MRDLISVLKMLPPHHPVLATQGGSREFTNSEALVDVLLNPRDRSYSVPQLFEYLERGGLVLGRWYWQAAYLPQCGYMARTPHGERLAKLPEVKRYGLMELWRGLMSTHSFVAYRDDADHARSKISFDDECLRYVPVRIPWTTIVQNSPMGGAGVLINQTHVFQDLFVVVNDRQKLMYEAIDGRRTIGEILESVNEAENIDAREFFETLWLYDQIVFDTSKARSVG
jgi:hypothetical protein